MPKEQEVLDQEQKEVKESETPETNQEPNEDTSDEEVEGSQEQSDEADESKKEESKEEATPERPVYNMPVKKHQAEKAKWREKEAEYQKQLEEMEAKLSSVGERDLTDDEVSKFAEEQGLDAKAVQGLISLAEKKFSSKAPVDKIDKLLKEQEVNEYKRQVETDFEANVTERIKQDFPGVTSEHLNKIKKEITDLAFSPKYNRYDVLDIYLVNKDKFEFKDNYTAEGSSGRNSEFIDYNNVTDKDIEAMSPEEYYKYSEAMAKKQGKWK